MTGKYLVNLEKSLFEGTCKFLFFDPKNSHRALYIDLYSNQNNHTCTAAVKLDLVMEPTKNIMPKKVYPCGQCEKTYSTTSHRARHKKTVHQKVRYDCDWCKNSYTRRETLKNHLKSNPPCALKQNLFLENVQKTMDELLTGMETPPTPISPLSDMDHFSGPPTETYGPPGDTLWEPRPSTSSQPDYFIPPNRDCQPHKRVDNDGTTGTTGTQGTELDMSNPDITQIPSTSRKDHTPMTVSTETMYEISTMRHPGMGKTT